MNIGYTQDPGAALSGGSATPRNVATTAATGPQLLPLCSASAPSARLWTVDLSSWVAQELTALDTCFAKVTFSGGGDAGGASEVAIVDYPAAGTVFSVHARDIRVEALVTIAAGDVAGRRPPNLSAWLTPAGASQRAQSATLTGPTAAFAIAATRVVDVPARARAFRIMDINAIQLTSMFSQQLSGNATPRALCGDVVSTPPSLADALGTSPWSEPCNRSKWFPLHPMAKTMTLADGSAIREYAVQWLLELG